MANVYFLTKDCMYEYVNGRVVKKELKKEKGIYTSVIYFKDIFNHTFKLPANLNKDELLIKADETVFNEAGLDLAKEYKINYLFQKYDDYYVVDAFIVEVERLKQEFSDILKKFKYIDFISAAPLVFKEYYDIVNIEPQNDVFIYFTEKDAFIAGFRDKEFVFVNSLDKLSTLRIQTSLSMDELRRILKEYGLNKELYEENEELYNKIYNFFSQFFMKVNNLLNYSKNFYKFDEIHRIFFYSDIEINNLIESYSDFWNLSGIEFKKFEIDTEYDPFKYCVTVYNAKNYKNEDVNFSIFLRPPKFYKTESGKLIIFSAFILFLILGDLLYKYTVLNQQEEKITRLQQLLGKKEKQYDLLKSSVEAYEKKIKKEKEKISEIEKKINTLALEIDYLYNLRYQSPLYNEIADIVNFLSDNNLKLVNFEKNNHKYTLLIKSNLNNSKLIPIFMKYLMQLGYTNISSKEIINEKNKYITQIKCEK